jgi:hypothetical protein
MAARDHCYYVVYLPGRFPRRSIFPAFDDAPGESVREYNDDRDSDWMSDMRVGQEKKLRALIRTYTKHERDLPAEDPTFGSADMRRLGGYAVSAIRVTL